MKPVLFVPVMLFIGCATSTPTPQKPTTTPMARQDGKVIECRRERPTGLLRSVEVCRDVAEASRRDKESKEYFENMRQPPASEQTLGR